MLVKSVQNDFVAGALTQLSCNFTELIEHIQGRAAAAAVCIFSFPFS